MKKIEKKRKQTSKQKKVTLKFFLNKAVQPMVENKIKRYPLYVLITYDRKNTMIRSHYSLYYRDLDEIGKVHYPGLLELEERAIRKTIAYEIAQGEKDFEMKGIYKKYELYCTGIHLLMDKYMKNQLWNLLLRLEAFEYAKALNFNDPDVSFETLYGICMKIYKGFSDVMPKQFEKDLKICTTFIDIYRGSFFQYSFPMVIEWLDGSAIDQYKEKLQELNMNDNLMIKHGVGFIDRIIQRELSIG